MSETVADRFRPLRRTAAAVGAVALIVMAAAPASAEGGTATGDLLLGQVTPLDGVKIGSSIELPGTFANKGAKALDKIYLSYGVGAGLAIPELPSNCDRVGRDIESDANLVICEFNQTVKAGGIYAPEKTLSLKVLDYALNDSTSVMVSTYDSRRSMDPSEGGPIHSFPGTGPAVKLAELPSTTPVGDGDHPSRSGEDQWDSSDLEVNVVNTADFQVSAQQTGRVGKAVSLEAKFTNAGPGWVYHYEDDVAPLVTALVKVPAGTTVTKKDNRCKEVEPGSYSCYPYSSSYVKAGFTDAWAFTLRIDKAVAGAKVSVSLQGEARPYDKNKKNDSATLLLDTGSDSTGGSVSTGGSSAGGSTTGGDGSTSSAGGSGSAGGSDSTSGAGGAATGGSTSTGGTGSATTGSAGTSGASTTGGGLANTGSGSTLPLAGAAAATLAAGAGTVLLIRRRAARN
ncbi:hypothetical protein [Streptomyces sp. NBC_01013]|uniref:hypothetical protein n=1 Tax=Streptomyces sp. NBC_01013 TaxID=2903718 RepID=UPI0038651287|nr:hypothetical protein OG538_15850 [Streptomyces sp. NBC_01013]